MSEAIVDLSQLLEQYRLTVLCESPDDASQRRGAHSDAS